MNRRAEVMSRLVQDLEEARQVELREGRRAALPIYQAILAAIPADPPLLLLAAQRLSLMHRFRFAVEAAERAAAIAPAVPQFRFVLGQIYFMVRRPAEAAETYRQVLASGWQQPAVYSELGVALVALGDLAGAETALREASARGPDLVAPLHELVLMRTMTADDPALARLEALKARAGSLGPAHQVRLSYALGKAYDDIGDYERAFGHFMEGATLQSTRLVPHDHTQMKAGHEAAPLIFTPARLERARETGDPDERPVFIIGMPRSGTTLTEQILAGHSHVASVGETAALTNVFGPWIGDRNPSDHAAMDEIMTAASLRGAAEAFWEELDEYGGIDVAARRVIEKTPLNYVGAGFIKAMFPRAHLVHCRRNALETAWSCFSMWFRSPTPWSYAFSDTARLMADYRRLMHIWQERLGAEIFDLPYESLVGDLEGQARALIKHVGLDWQSACLDFAGSGRTVVTPSMAQVRQPVYRSSLNRAQKYRPFLTGLIEALEREGVDPAS